MSVIHRTTLRPTKLELLASWLPSRPWYRGGAAEPSLARAGGFRLDDPQGEVGIEFIVVTDASGSRPAAYLVPLTYRSAPLDGAEDALVGTTEHGVLGKRWVYDGCHDPVLVERFAALAEGRAQAQSQDVSDTPDRDVAVSHGGEDPLLGDFAHFTVAEDRDGTELTAPHGAALRLHRVLRPAPDGPSPARPGTAGRVTGSWQAQDGTRVRGVFAVSRVAGRA